MESKLEKLSPETAESHTLNIKLDQAAMVSTLAHLGRGGMVPSSRTRSRSCLEMHLDVRHACVLARGTDKRFRDLQKRRHWNTKIKINC